MLFPGTSVRRPALSSTVCAGLATVRPASTRRGRVVRMHPRFTRPSMASSLQKPRGFLRSRRYPRRAHNACQASSSTNARLRPRTLQMRTHASLLTRSSDATASLLIALMISLSVATSGAYRPPAHSPRRWHREPRARWGPSTRPACGRSARSPRSFERNRVTTNLRGGGWRGPIPPPSPGGSALGSAGFDRDRIVRGIRPPICGVPRLSPRWARAR